MQTTWRLILGVLIGANLMTFLAAQVVFEARDGMGLSSSAAGTIAGNMLHRANLMTGVGLMLLIALDSATRRALRQPGAAFWIMMLLVVGLIATLAEMVVITPSIAGMRESIAEEFGTMQQAPDNVRARFGMLHGVSMLRGLLVLVLMSVCFVLDSRASEKAAPAGS